MEPPCACCAFIIHHKVFNASVYTDGYNLAILSAYIDNELGFRKNLFYTQGLSFYFSDGLGP
jgi:hypothetical protein